MKHSCAGRHAGCAGVPRADRTGRAQGRGAQPPVSTARAERSDRPDRLLGVGRHAGLAMADGHAARKATTRAFRSRSRPRRSATAGIRRRTKQRESNASPMELRRSWPFQRACGSPGRTTTTLKVETDAGTQTRLFRFGNRKPQRGPATWQGESIAEWERPRAARGATPKGGSLKVVTSHLRPGYLRKNGVPYSADAVLTEYWDLSARSERR